MLQPTSQFFVSQRLRLHYVDWGNAHAPPLLLLHGGRDHARNWDWVAADLARDWHVIAPDLRGHGDSAWSPEGNYATTAFVYDLAQLITGQGLAPLTIVAHSFGGNIALRYAGAYPENVARLVAIEGLWRPRQTGPADVRLRRWIDELRGLSHRLPKRYASIDEACVRMLAENKHLSPAQAGHLTRHGVLRNEDGSFGWKFDNYVRTTAPVDFSVDEVAALWARIVCPTLLVYGSESWMPVPTASDLLAPFADVRVETFARAGHWVHHDRTVDFVACLRAFLGGPDRTEAASEQ